MAIPVFETAETSWEMAVPCSRYWSPHAGVLQLHDECVYARFGMHGLTSQRSLDMAHSTLLPLTMECRQSAVGNAKRLHGS